MEIKTHLRVVRWLLMVGLLAWGTIYLFAQTQAAQPPRPPAQAQKPPLGKMRGTTNSMRMAAAIRAADRKAQAQKKATTSGRPTGVKQ